MATFCAITLNGNLIAKPECKEFANGSSLWNFTLAQNAKHKDKENTGEATIWYKVSYNAPADDKFMNTLEKGSCVMVSGKLPYTLNQYSASYSSKEGKYSMNLAVDAYGVTRGTFDSKKPTESGDKEADSFYPAKPDGNIPTEDFVPPNKSSAPQGLKF